MVSSYIYYERYVHVDVVVPVKYAQQVLFNIYVPKKIPAGFSLNPRNFEVKDGDVLLFEINNKNNDNIVFSEQAIPSGFDFDDFYQQYMANLVNLQGTPYKSVAGNVADSNRKLLSITANDTWILITTPRSITVSDLQFIANNIVRQN